MPRSRAAYPPEFPLIVLFRFAEPFRALIGKNDSQLWKLG